VRTIIVESLDRFVRDLAVQFAGRDYLKNLGVALIPASAPEHFLEETPTAVLVRQVLGAMLSSRKRPPSPSLRRLASASEARRASARAGSRMPNAALPSSPLPSS